MIPLAILFSPLADNPLFAIENFDKEKLKLKLLMKLINYLLLTIIFAEPKIYKN
jgi:hypothetical protein